MRAIQTARLRGLSFLVRVAVLGFFGFFREGFRVPVRVPGRLRRGFRVGRFFGALLFRSGLFVPFLDLIA